MLRYDGLETILRTSALPDRAIEQIRIHYMLDVLFVTGIEPPSDALPSGALTYDWKTLDYAVDMLMQHGMKVHSVLP
jgi:hypothetical protein